MACTPIWCQAVTWTSADILLIGPFGTNFSELWIQLRWFSYTKMPLKENICQPFCSCLNSLRPSDAYIRQWTNHHCFRQWLVAWPAPSHCLNQCWNIVTWTFRNNLQWNLNWNSNIFIQENAFENFVWKMSAILSWPYCVNKFSASLGAPFINMD